MTEPPGDATTAKGTREPDTLLYPRHAPLRRLAALVVATRPAFLSASVLPVAAAGALVAAETGHVDVQKFVMAIAAVALIHSGANVLNDYFDALSGTDDRNVARIHPFTGGSRFIQNGVLTRREVGILGTALVAVGAAIGLLAAAGSPLLLAVGLAGVVLAILYTAPPCLACRGLGDIVIVATFGVLPAVGTSLLLAGRIVASAWWLGIVCGLLAAAILWINSIPDIDSDRSTGKLTVPARLGRRAALMLLPLWSAAAFAVLLVSPLPRASCLALAAVAPALAAARAARRGRLRPAIVMTIATHATACIGLIAGLLIAASR